MQNGTAQWPRQKGSYVGAYSLSKGCARAHITAVCSWESSSCPTVFSCDMDRLDFQGFQSHVCPPCLVGFAPPRRLFPCKVPRDCNRPLNAMHKSCPIQTDTRSAPLLLWGGVGLLVLSGCATFSKLPRSRCSASTIKVSELVPNRNAWSSGGTLSVRCAESVGDPFESWEP